MYIYIYIYIYLHILYIYMYIYIFTELKPIGERNMKKNDTIYKGVFRALPDISLFDAWQGSGYASEFTSFPIYYYFARLKLKIRLITLNRVHLVLV